MIDFATLLSAAQQLPTDDRLRLIDALWETVPAESDLPFHPEWEAELERRVAALKAGATATLPWSTIRDAALARIGHGNVH